MRTERASFSYLIFALFVIFGMLSGSWVLFVLAGITASVLVASSTMAPGDIEIYGKRELSDDRVYEDGEIKVRLRIRNKGRGTMFQVIETVPDDAELDGEIEEIDYLKNGKSMVLRYSVRFPLKGKYTLGPVKIRCFDPMLFWVREYTIDIKDRIDVYVGTEDLKKVRLEPTRTRNWLGNIQSRRIGTGTEFYSIREYVSGDDVRKINWKGSARTGKILVNEYEGENSGDAIIVLDAKEEYMAGTERHSTFKAGVRATLSIASHMLRQRNRVGLILLGDYLTWIYPEFGRRQLYKIMEALSTLKKGGKWEFDTLYWIITRFFPANSYIIIISTLQSREIPETVISLRARGYDVLIISPSPVAIERSLSKDDLEHRLAFRIMDMKRENVVDALQEKAAVIDWDTSVPLAEKLKAVRRFGRWQR